MTTAPPKPGAPGPSILSAKAVVLGERIDTRRSLRLEVIIVVLILAEITLTLLQMARG